MSVDRAPAHVSDMLGFVRELRSLAGHLSLRSWLAALDDSDERR